MIWFILGLLFGFLLDVLWWHKGFNKYERGVLKNLEHWHWGLIVLFLRHELAYGLACALFVEERFQKNFFSYGSDHFKASCVIGGTIIVLLLASLFFY